MGQKCTHSRTEAIFENSLYKTLEIKPCQLMIFKLLIVLAGCVIIINCAAMQHKPAVLNLYTCVKHKEQEIDEY